MNFGFETEYDTKMGLTMDQVKLLFLFLWRTPSSTNNTQIVCLNQCAHLSKILIMQPEKLLDIYKAKDY